jgi:hypothetical protein
MIKPQTAVKTTPAEARAIAKEAYIFGFPLVDSYRIQYSYFVDRNNPEFKAPWNEIHNEARVYTSEDKVIQTPNSDTLYSVLGADLRAEPLVLTMPAVERGRYYSAQFIDMYTFNFAYVGSRATGNATGNFLLAGPHWKGDKPDGIKDVIRCETEFAFVLYRTQLFKPYDIENVKKVQAGYRVQTLSEFLQAPAPARPPAIDFIPPLSADEERTSLEFFNILNFVLRFCPTHASETELMARFARIGIGPKSRLDVKFLSPEMRTAIEGGMDDAWRENAELRKRIADGKIAADLLFGTRSHLKNNYSYRMAASAGGIYGNSREEAFYHVYYLDSSGQRLDTANNCYTLRFAFGQLPPVNAFWSITLYELPSQLLSANPLNRYLINSPMLPDLTREADGGLTLYVQHDSPGKDKESNWLPAPEGPIKLGLRLYWPKKEVSEGIWKAPEMKRASQRERSQSFEHENKGTRHMSKKSQPTVAPEPVPVTVANFSRAETDMYFASIVSQAGGTGRFTHHRDLMPIDKQIVVRSNRDTLYSSGIFDLDAGPVAITLPDAGKRFLSLQIINEDQYSPLVAYNPGSHTLTREQIGTRYALAAIRILVNPLDPKDIDEVRALQDAVQVEQANPGRFEAPNWDQSSQKKIHEALLVLGATLPDSRRMFGTKDQVDPMRFLIGSAMAWGGNPETEATYINVTPRNNDGKTVHRLRVKDVPVNGFWSICLYNEKGYFEPNAQGAYSINNFTAKKDADGSVTIQFGGCDGETPNCLPIMPGWNYIVRLYRPRPEILNGTWKFPEAQPEPSVMQRVS